MLSKEELTTNVVVEETELVDIGRGEVRVRGMSRWELMEANKIRTDKGDMAAERFILSQCLIDPAMGEHDIAAWQKGSFAPEINIVADKVNAMSGTKQGADKSAVDRKSVV